MKDIQDLNKWRSIPWKWIERLNRYDLIDINSNKIYLQIQCNHNQNHSMHLLDFAKRILKFTRRNKGTKLTKQS